MASEAAQEGSAIEQVFAGGGRQHIGWYRYYFADDRWIWSDEVALMHGYAPGTVTPTTELVLSHKHPDDYEQVASILREFVEPIRRSAPAIASSPRRETPGK